jgi:hypothetical protein
MKLKAVFERKKKLHEKLRKLNEELKNLTAEQSNKVTISSPKNKSESVRKQKNLSDFGRSKHNAFPSFSSYGSVRAVSLNECSNELEMSRKAIEFIKRVSEERRINLKKKFNQIAAAKTKNCAYIDGSRLKYDTVIIEGEAECES